MWKVRDAVVADFVAHFPAALQTTKSKYHIVLEQILRALPVLPGLWRIGAA